jgi:hypothetical protein
MTSVTLCLCAVVSRAFQQVGVGKITQQYPTLRRVLETA